MTYTNMQKIFPEFEENAKLKKAFFHAMDEDSNGAVHFYEYAKGLSVMCRGTIEERVQFVFDLIDIDGNRKVDMEELAISVGNVQAVVSRMKEENEELEAVEVSSGEAIEILNEVNNEEDDAEALKKYKQMQIEESNDEGIAEEETDDEEHKRSDNEHEWFFIRSMFNGLYLDLKGNNARLQTPVITWPYNGFDNQKWRWGTDDQGKKYLINKASSDELAVGVTKKALSLFDSLGYLVLKNKGERTTNFDIDGKYVHSTDGPYEGKVMDIKGANMWSKGQTVCMYKKKTESTKISAFYTDRIQSNQFWEIIPCDNTRDHLYQPSKMMTNTIKMKSGATFRIKSLFNRTVIAPERDALKTKKEDLNNDAQLFRWDDGCLCHCETGDYVGIAKSYLVLVKEKEDALSLAYTSPYLEVMDSTKHQGKLFDIKGARQSAGAPVLLWESNDQANQRWELVPSEKIEEPDNEVLLGFNQFIMKCQNSDEFVSCFGLFDAMHFMKLKKLEEAVEKVTSDPKYTGKLKAMGGDEYWTTVYNGFLNFYETKEDCANELNPVNQMDLIEASVETMHTLENCIVVKTPRSEFVYQIEDGSLMDEWLLYITANCPPKIPHQFKSFAPVRQNIGCQYFIGGQKYFEDLVKEIERAEQQILLTGWFISHQLYLIRSKDSPPDPKYRLDNLLLAAAERGVKIYILCWDEIDAAFKLGSKYVVNDLAKSHPNIQTLRDPKSGFLFLWSHHQKTVMIDQRIAYAGGIDVAYNRFDTHDYPLTDEGANLFWGKDYLNPMIKTKYIGDPDENYYDRSKSPRMPWHDHQVKVVGKAAQDLSRNFVERWNVSKTQQHDHIIMFDPPADENEEKYGTCQVQVLRSAAKWSLGITITEKSIYYAHLHAIQNAKNFIYIENQFFVSATDVRQKCPKNHIVRALYQRISKAILNKEKFVVIFVTPVHSSSNMNGRSVQTLTQWQYSTSIRGKHALYTVLKERFKDQDINVEDYFKLFALRNYGKFSTGKYCTEMVYVHSKLLLVDDDIAFISSANINDRSMMGYRDSEIGCRIVDTEKVPVPFGGKEIEVSKFVHDLRMECFQIILGKEGEELDEFKDPVESFARFKEISHNNTEIYIEQFKHVEDVIYNSIQIKQLESVRSMDVENPERLEEIQGLIVDFPKKFLSYQWSHPSVDYAIDKFYC
eukprot:CAMPEP_0117426704 /NCGR_PEP_ID=MMETSP0758-20121206/6743_1 /TAXON_ID=63605 /ORGANISM="Percolomonas cosmopolitus, Strain AE-1 (ATCC 50343)" /LENGTH=1178 /DNA_ID=CAMNT_0005211989 /DNA_START=244 /DNA_END=3780 /DNA_ORIENTATION=-